MDLLSLEIKMCVIGLKNGRRKKTKHISNLIFLTLCDCIMKKCDFSVSFHPLEISLHFNFSPPSLFYLAGPVSNRLEPPSLSDAGDVSPIVLMSGLTVGEPLSPSDTTLEESLERDR